MLKPWNDTSYQLYDSGSRASERLNTAVGEGPLMTDVDAKTERPRITSNADSATPAASDHVLKGVSILGFNPESRAEKAGMEKGDVIVQYSGTGDLTVQKLATLTTVLRSEGVPTDMILVRNGQEYSLTLPYGPLGISAMDTMLKAPAGSEAHVAIDKVVQGIQQIYLLLIALGLLSSLGFLGITPRPSTLDLLGEWQRTFVRAIDCVIFLGLQWRKKWVITLVLIFSALGCATILFNIMQPVEEMRALLLRISLLLFYGYQIYFFSRKDVRERFGSKRTLVVQNRSKN